MNTLPHDMNPMNFFVYEDLMQQSLRIDKIAIS